ncbi:MerR family regulatory protein [Ornithinibacillus halophilus]|uniref:MerR family regulatory protein n=1 Tax=Ornithinibacillus halophilus TaxID=930117 RepID=A0A1M5JUW7_9BACI|nr:MerR family regulatory protein [Ornithinibacillus halophilus]
MNKETYSISELASHFGITTRTIRYYEELGLLSPERTDGGQRRLYEKLEALPRNTTGKLLKHQLRDKVQQ